MVFDFRRIQMVDESSPTAGNESIIETPKQLYSRETPDTIPSARRDPFDLLEKSLGGNDQIPAARSPADLLQATPKVESGKSGAKTSSKLSSALKLFSTVDEDEDNLTTANDGQAGLQTPKQPSKSESSHRTPETNIVTRSMARAAAT